MPSFTWKAKFELNGTTKVGLVLTVQIRADVNQLSCTVFLSVSKFLYLFLKNVMLVFHEKEKTVS